MANEPSINPPSISGGWTYQTDEGDFIPTGGRMKDGYVMPLVGGPDGDDQQTQDDQPVGPEPSNPSTGAPEAGGPGAPMERGGLG